MARAKNGKLVRAPTSEVQDASLGAPLARTPLMSPALAATPAPKPRGAHNTAENITTFICASGEAPKAYAMPNNGSATSVAAAANPTAQNTIKTAPISQSALGSFAPRMTTAHQLLVYKPSPVLSRGGLLE